MYQRVARRWTCGIQRAGSDILWPKGVGPGSARRPCQTVVLRFGRAGSVRPASALSGFICEEDEGGDLDVSTFSFSSCASAPRTVGLRFSLRAVPRPPRRRGCYDATVDSAMCAHDRTLQTPRAQVMLELAIGRRTHSALLPFCRLGSRTAKRVRK